MSTRRPLAAVYVEDATGGAWLVAETPDEVHALITAALSNGERFVQLTLGNPVSEGDVVRWNGRPVYVRANAVTAIGPPLEPRDDDENTE